LNLFERWRAEPTIAAPTVQKAFSYVTREGQHGLELLVFEHLYPKSGVQIPKGTVDEDETPEEAAFREVIEEAGLRNLTLVRHLGTDVVHYPNDPENDQVQERHFFHLRVASAVPDTWRHVVRGEGDDHGMVFLFYWIPPSKNPQLVANMGDYLHLLEEVVSSLSAADAGSARVKHGR
jgi:8-oxo-dGTP pyrophosphatase MutT (NUDIX family)